MMPVADHGFDFDYAVCAPFRMRPGLRRRSAIAPVLTATLDAHGNAGPVFHEKLRALRRLGPRLINRQPGFDAQPALQTLTQAAARHHPRQFQPEGEHGWHAPALGWSLRHDQLIADHAAFPEVGPLLAALPADARLPALLALLFEEDVAVIDGVSGCVPWLLVCLPSFWSPAEKVGKHFVQIHDPVADSTLLRTAGDHLMRLVCGPDHWERYGWTLTAHPRLAADPQHDPREPWPVGDDPAALARVTGFRTEHQVFVPVPASTQALFTIRVGLSPLNDAIHSAARARQLHDSLASMTREVIAYRGLSPARDRLLAWFAARAVAAP